MAKIMTQTEFIIKQIAKTNKKNYENYVVTRIWHRLNQTDIKFMTQQYVKLSSGYALTDLYFPQFNLHIEVDEPHHKKQQKLDIKRETNIIEATNHIIMRVTINDDIDFINQQIEEIILYITSMRIEKIKEGSFKPFDLAKEFDPNYHREKGYLAVKENPSFRLMLDACNCLGQNYQGLQKAWVMSKVFKKHSIWFPKLYENKDWDNRMSDDGSKLTEKCKDKSKQQSHFQHAINLVNQNVKQIIFPRYKDNLGFVLYRFRGIFEIDIKNSSIENGVIHQRIDTRIDIK